MEDVIQQWHWYLVRGKRCRALQKLFRKKGHPSVLEVQKKLANIGYKLELSGVQDLPSQFAVRAFQARYTPDNMDGFLDNETTAVIFAIEKKYRQ